MTLVEVIQMDNLLFRLMRYHIILKQQRDNANTHDDCKHTNFDNPVGLLIL